MFSNIFNLFFIFLLMFPFDFIYIQLLNTTCFGCSEILFMYMPDV